jgi:RHS repeat-associated protein
MRSGGASFFFQHDAIGTVTDVTSSSGDPERHYAYDPFGTVRVSTQPDPAAPDNVVGFAGQMNDASSGTQYMRARTYDSSNGRFLSRDPLVRGPFAPTESAYSYADDRPSVLIDPSGMGPVWQHEPCSRWTSMIDPGCMPWRRIGACETGWGLIVGGIGFGTAPVYAGWVGVGEGAAVASAGAESGDLGQTVFGIWDQTAGLHHVGVGLALGGAPVGLGGFIGYRCLTS